MASTSHHRVGEDWAIWAAAVAVAVGLHVGGLAVAFANLQTLEDAALGAPAYEVGIELSSPRQDMADLPPGPDAEASVAAPEMMEQKAATQPTELPTDIPTDTDTADRVVTEKPVEKSDDKEPDQSTVNTPASEASVASEATAAPGFEAPPQSTTAVAPAQGTGSSAALERVTWQKQLVTHLEKHKRYPGDRAGKAASIVVGFELDRLGRVRTTQLVQSSGDDAFDRAAIDMLKRADPLPAPPPSIADEGLAFTVPVIFRQRK